MQTYSIKKTNKRLQPVFGFLTPEEDSEIRKVLSETDTALLEFATYFGLDHAGWERTGLDFNWYESGHVSISSFVETGIDGNQMISFGVSLHPTWFYDKLPTEPEWRIEAEIYADCQHSNYCGSMHCVYELPSITCTNPLDSVKALHKIFVDLMKLGKEKPIEYWLQLAGDNP
jgi:hypothetical protein